MLDEHGEGKTSFVGEDSRLETMMAWAGAGLWAARWATRGRAGKAAR
jgi:hypothetical protein